VLYTLTPKTLLLIKKRIYLSNSARANYRSILLLKQEYPPFFPSLVPTRIPFCPPLARTVASQHLFIISLHSCSYSFPTVTPTSRSLHFSFLLALFGLKHTRLRLKQLNKPRWGPPAFGGRARRLACSLLWAEGAPIVISALTRTITAHFPFIAKYTLYHLYLTHTSHLSYT
jgi:hypothetical protein